MKRKLIEPDVRLSPRELILSRIPASTPANLRAWLTDALLELASRQGLARFLSALGALYQSRSCLWRTDPDPTTFAWIDCTDRDSSIVSYQRRDGEAHLVVVLNLTPVPRDAYRVGMPGGGSYVIRLASDAREFGGAGYPLPDRVTVESIPWHGLPQSAVLRLPPLGALILAPA